MIHNRFCSHDLEAKVRLVSYPPPPRSEELRLRRHSWVGNHLEPFVQHQKPSNHPEDVDLVHLECNLSSPGTGPGLKESVWLLGQSGILRNS